MTSPSSGVAGDLDHQLSAASTLKTCFEGVSNVITGLRTQTANILPTALQGASGGAALAVHEELYNGVQSQCRRGDDQCQLIIKNAQLQWANTQHGAKNITGVVGGAPTSGVGVINA